MMIKGDPGRWLSTRLKPGQTVFDIGANVGQCAAEFLTAVGPSGKVYALEPDARCWDTFKTNAPEAILVRAAAGAVNGTADLVLGTLTPQSSLRPAAVVESAGTEHNVPVMRLDAIPAVPDAVKIDVQGTEFEVLEGAGCLLRTCPLWVVEIWPWGLPKHADSVEAIWYVFDRIGKSPHRLDPTATPVTYAELMDWVTTTSPKSFMNLAWMEHV